MYFDLFLPFPVASAPIQAKKKGGQGKNKASGSGASTPNPTSGRRSCWDGLEVEEKDGFARTFALAGHLGYSVVGCTVSREPEAHAFASPFVALPYPHLDPRHSHSSTGVGSGSSGNGSGRGGSGSGSGSGAAPPKAKGPGMVQVTRYHFRLDDAKVNPLIASNTSILREYDILSCYPTNEKAMQLACTDLSNPGPNQLSIITLPLHERPFHFRLNRKQVKQAQRNGVVFEILYSAALFPSPNIPAETARRWRQNFMTNTREIIRITSGKGVIFSSGPGGSVDGLRGPLDVVNLAAVLGMPANLAKDSVSLNPKMVLLKAQARRTFKAVFSMPKMMPAPGLSTTETAALQEPPEADIDVAIDTDVEMGDGVKRQREQGEGEDAKTGPKKSKKQATVQAVMA
ncbi:hypothetical protein EHS25_009603 [Saitozyma podzolica]|uniref:Uncharacterized protein n=1 Tax=Saitozyma podzolica TaxID=1890683 RepID=A0A427YJN1_9TREE|nr:hypothetical protein EHS25_009603 [Saitozyma podzolica]